MQKDDLKSQCKPDEKRLAMERETNMGTTMKEEADHHEYLSRGWSFM